MRVTLGLRLDERQGPLVDGGLAQPVLGRLGFLGLLEIHLGLAGPEVSRPERVAAYLGHLRRQDDGSRFYSKSLKVDEVGAAAELLSWRDEWLLAGWNGTTDTCAPPRIRDLAAVELAAAGNVPPGEAERLIVVRIALIERQVPVEMVQLVDSAARFPKVWQDVLDLLPCNEPSPPSPVAEGFLGQLQFAMLESSRAGVVQAMKATIEDGSTHVYRAMSREVAMNWLSARCLATPADRLVLCEDGGAALDETFRVTGVSACGFDEQSPLRPALQTLALALELLWTPIDVHRMLEFLMHPYGPFGRRSRRRLARAFSDQPGFGSEAWELAKKEISVEDKGSEILAELKFWLEGDHWNRDDGADIDAVVKRVEKVARAMRAKLSMGGDDVSAVGGAVMQCEAAGCGLDEMKRQGIERLKPRHIEQLLAQATTAGAANPLAQSEVGCWRSAVTPALALLELADEVIWWMPASPRLPARLPWSPAEVGALSAQGAKLREPLEEMKALAEDWLRPLLAAKQRFILVLPPEGEEEHPIWQLVRRIVPGLTIKHIELELGAGGVLANKVEDKPLPNVKRYLEVAGPILSRREFQSYTSLSDIFNTPAVSVLKDAADLRSGTALQIETENRLFGTLAHRAAEHLFGQLGVLEWPEGRARAWLDDAVDALVSAEGVPLLMKGASVALHHFKRTTIGGMLALLEHLRSAGAIGVSTEVEYKGFLDSIALVGKVDLVVHFPEKHTAALDMKWTRTSRYVDVLRNGEHLQLALYGSLIREHTGNAPVALGYFIIDSRTLLVASSGLFPNARVCSPKSGITMDGLLDMAKASWAWRRGQLDNGVVEVVDFRVDDETEFQGPEGTLPVTSTGPWNAEYQSLLGWEAQ